MSTFFLYVADVVVFILLFCLVFLVAIMPTEYLAPDLFYWGVQHGNALRFLGVIPIGIAFFGAQYFHRHCTKENIFGVAQLIIAILILLWKIAKLIFDILLPIVGLYLIYHFIFK